MKKYPAILVLLFFTNTAFNQNRFNYNQHQFHLGTESSIIHSPTIDLGYTYRKVERKVKTKRTGIIASYFYESKTNNDSNTPFYFHELSENESRIEKNYTENYLRLKPFIERGRKVICVPNYTLDIGAVVGLGLNIIRKIEINYLTIDSKGNIANELTKEIYMDKNKSYFMQPDIFSGLRLNNIFDLRNGKFIFLSGLAAYDFGLYNSGLKGWLFQIELGFAISS